MIILHGLFGMLDNWKSIGAKLSKQFTVFLIDQRNHGKSFHHPDMNYQLLAQDIKKFMENHWVFEAFVIGHSMGGKVAMQLALNHPDLVTKLIVVDIAPKKYNDKQDKLLEIMLKIEPGSYSERKALLSEFEKEIGDETVSRLLSKNLKRNREGTYSWKMNVSSIYKNYQYLLNAPQGDHKYESPSLFVKGSNSNYIIPGDEDLIKLKFPDATFKTIEGAGHWVHIDSPDRFVLTIQNFLNADSINL